MRHNDPFGQLHPAAVGLFFLILLTVGLLTAHPLFTGISLAAGCTYYIVLHGGAGARLLLRGALPVFLITFLLNPLFSHEGKTVLAYFPSGNPLTLESTVYGITTALTLTAVLIWFLCFSDIFTGDRLMYLLGRVLPALSLTVSLSLRFLPRFRDRFAAVRQTQSALGRDTGNGSLPRRLRNTLACFSAVVGWSLESAMQTADSMKSRGYGSARRTFYALYRVTARDKAALAFFLLCGVLLTVTGLCGGLSFSCFPTVMPPPLDPLTAVCAAFYAIFCFTPFILDREEERLWRSLA